MLSIDILTIMFVLAVFNILSAVFFMLYLRLTHVKMNLNTFILSKALQGLSWLFRLLVYTHPVYWILVIADLFLLFGFAMESVLFVRFKSEISKRLKNYYMISLGIIGASVFIFSGASPEIKDLLILFAFMSYMYIISWKLLMSRESTPFQKLIGISYGTLPIISSLLFVTITEEVTVVGEVTSITGILYYISILFMQLIGGIGYLLMVNERDENALREFAIKDPLTGVLNRRAFYDYASLLVNKSIHENVPFALVMIDIDHFKQINDTHGHIQGDKVIKSLCTYLTSEMRKNDILARFGGEEFLIMLYDMDETGVKGFVTRIYDHLSESISTKYGDVNAFTISSGVCASDPTSVSDLDVMIKYSDDALYHSKNNGRDQATLVHVADSGLRFERITH